MFPIDMPPVPPQEQTIVIAQADLAQQQVTGKERILGVCHPVPNSIPPEGARGEYVVDPIYNAEGYFIKYEHKTVTGATNVTVLKEPRNGTLQLMTAANVASFGSGRFVEGSKSYAYFPNPGYVGNDRAMFLVDIGGQKVKVVYFFQSVDHPLGNTGYVDLCATTGLKWKISSTLDPDGTNTITSIEYQSPTTSPAGATVEDTATLASTLGTTLLSTLAGETTGVTVNLADLHGAAVGQTTGSKITLDTNAAGYNWFIDTTPADNSEYLPTSNPNEWVAKAGSAAAGKMDMLSVLLHEYGHALGINHSADPNDFMGTTLTAGVRRLPSADEMALMQSLVAEAKATLTPTLSQGERGQDAPTFPTLPLGTSFIGFLGLLRGSRYGGVSIAADTNTLVTQYDWAANATLTNGSLNAADGWSTQGSVNIGSGTAVMNEVSGTQTRLSQVFLLNPSDRFLSFTLAGTALDDLTGAPDDAFEVALLDANTGASLLTGPGRPAPMPSSTCKPMACKKWQAASPAPPTQTAAALIWLTSQVSPQAPQSISRSTSSASARMVATSPYAMCT